MNDSIKAPSGAAVSSDRLVSARRKEPPKRTEEKPAKIVDSVVNEVGKARDQVSRITEASQGQVEVIKQMEASQPEVADLDLAIQLGESLKLRIPRDPALAQEAQLGRMETTPDAIEKIKQLLRS